jgi:hypothetical protein
MNDLLAWLGGGDLRSDGAAGQAAEAVLKNEGLMPDLAEGLSSADEVVRGRTMDAFEKVARKRPDLVLPYLPTILKLLDTEKTLLARMHAAMLFGHLAVYKDVIPKVLPVLLSMLAEAPVFTQSWAITSLCIIARKYPQHHAQIAARINGLRDDPSAALRTRVRYAMEILTDSRKPFPKGWVKSEKLGL